MKIGFRASTLPDHVRFEMSGAFSLDAILALCDRCFQLAAEAGRDAMLVDAREMGGPEPTMAERYTWAVRIAELQARSNPRIRVAFVAREPLLHPERFGEIVAARHGAVIRTFTDEVLALGWLLGAKRDA